MSPEENVYDEKSREDLVDNDEIDGGEEGFMQGYEESEEPEEEEKEEKDEDSEFE